MQLADRHRTMDAAMEVRDLSEVVPVLARTVNPSQSSAVSCVGASKSGACRDRMPSADAAVGLLAALPDPKLLPLEHCGPLSITLHALDKRGVGGVKSLEIPSNRLLAADHSGYRQ